MQNAAFPFVALISFFAPLPARGRKGPWEPACPTSPPGHRASGAGGESRRSSSSRLCPGLYVWGSGCASVSPTGGVEAVAPWSLLGDGAGTRRLVPRCVRTPGHTGGFQACRKPAPAAGEAELIPSLSAPSAAAFFQGFCWESAPFPPVCPVPSRTSRRPLLGGGCFVAGTPAPQLIPCITQLPATVSLLASNPAAGLENGSGLPWRQ